MKNAVPLLTKLNNFGKMSTTTSLLTGYNSSCRRLDFCILGGI